MKHTNLNYLETLPLPNTKDFAELKINELNTPQLKKESPVHQSESMPLKKKLETEDTNTSFTNFDQINVRTYVIATHIYYELFRSPEDIYELKKSTHEYVKTMKSLFRVHNLSDHNISKLKRFDYMKALKEKTASRKGQLRRQLEQIVSNPSVFGEDIAKYAEGLIKQYFY